MTHEEFSKWFDHHCTLFPDLPTWLKRIDRQNAILEKWMSLLDRAYFFDAKAASLRLYESETRPRTYADHPKWIAAECKRASPKRENAQAFAKFGQITYRCYTCRDTGIAEIYIVGDLLRNGLRMHGPEKVMRHTGCLFCDCEFGQSRGRPNLDRSWMIVSIGRSALRFEENPELAERRWQQVEAMRAEMEVMA